MLFLRSVFFAAAIPGTVVGLVPYLIVSGPPAPSCNLGCRRVRPGCSCCALASRFTGLVHARLRGHWARHRRALLIPPTTLVVQGLYRYIRNPMYVGALLTLLGETVFARSAPLLYYTAAWFIWVNPFRHSSMRSPRCGANSAPHMEEYAAQSDAFEIVGERPDDARAA